MRESWLVKWGRRAATIPLYCVAFALIVTTAAVWAPVLLAVDLALSGRRFPRTRTMLFFAVYLALELLGVALAAMLWLVRLGGAVGGGAAYVRANAALQRLWTGALFGGARRILGFRLLLEDGSADVSEGPFLLFVRHTSTADTVLASVLIANPHKILLRYVLKRELLWDPCLDIVGRRLPNSFVARGSARRDAEIAAVAALGVGLGPRDGALIYPEGTRFTAAKLEAARLRLRTDGKSELAAIADRLRHVLPPRLGGPLALLDAAPGVDVVVLEHTGFEGAATFGTLWSGKLIGSTVRVRLRRVAAAEIPTRARDRWLFDLWCETDRWVSERQSVRAQR